jgi:hypothetical protein
VYLGFGADHVIEGLIFITFIHLTNPSGEIKRSSAQYEKAGYNAMIHTHSLVKIKRKYNS